MRGSGRSKLATVTVAVSVLLIVAVPPSTVAPTQECEEREVGGVWMCAPGTDWVTSSQTVPSDLLIATQGDSEDVVLNTDLNSTEVYMDGYTTIIETPQDRLRIQPTGNIIKIFRNGTLEAQLVSESSSGHYWVEPEINVVEVPPNDVTCELTLVWELIYIDYDPGTLAPPPDVDLRVWGWWDQYEEDENVTMGNGSMEGDETTSQPTVLSGIDTVAWVDQGPVEPDWVRYKYFFGEDASQEEEVNTTFDDDGYDRIDPDC